MSRRGLEQLRQRFVEEGFEITIKGKTRGHKPRALNGADEARLIALVCSPKPDGRTRWTLRLLADKWSTLAQSRMVYPAGTRMRVCSGNGRYTGCLYQKIR